VRGVAGTWKDSDRQVQFDGSNMTGQVRTSPKSQQAVAKGNLSKKITVKKMSRALKFFS